MGCLSPSIQLLHNHFRPGCLVRGGVYRCGVTRLARAYDELAACRSAADLAWLREMRAVAAVARLEAQSGFAGFETDLIAAALGLHPQAAGRVVAHALALDALPALAAAVSDGRMTRQAVPRVLTELTALDPTRDPDVASRVVDDLLTRASSWGVRTPAQWARATRAAVLREDPRGLERRRQRAAADRDVRIAPADDGMAWVLLLTTALDAQRCLDALRTAAEQLSTDPDDDRTAEQRRADGAVALITGSPASTGTPDDLFHLAITDPDSTSTATTATCGQQPRRRRALRRRQLVDLVVPAATVLGQSDEPGDLRGLGPVTAAQAREVMRAGCEVRAVFTCHRTGEVLAVSPRTWTLPHAATAGDLRALIQDALASSARTPVTEPQYVPSEQLARFLTTRDRTSTWPGSSVPSTSCDLEHNQPWHQHGPTSPDNLRPVQRRAHRLKQRGYRYTPLPDGRIRWTAPERPTLHRPSPRQVPPPLFSLRT